MKKGIEVFFLLFLCSCTSEDISQKFKKIVINPEPETLYASDYFNDIKYIPLETDSVYISNIEEICSTSDDFFVSDGKVITRFNKNGDFLNTIGSVGRGPKEYEFIQSMTVSEATKTVWVAKPGGIVVYDYSGKFKKDIHLPSRKGASTLQPVGNDIICTQGNMGGQGEASWFRLNQAGKEVGYRPNYFKFEPVKMKWAFSTEHIFYPFAGSVYCKELNSDTIFDVNEKYTPAYILDQNKHGFDIEARVRDNGRYWFNNSGKFYVFRGIYETDSYLFLNFIFQGKRLMNIYDKDSGLVRGCSRGTNEGLLNDIDGGFPVKPKRGMNGRNLALGWINAFEMKDHVDSEAFMNFEGDQKKKQEFLRLANNLDEKDNPVLVIYSAK